MFQIDDDRQERKSLKEQGLPDGEQDRDPQTARQRKLLAVVVNFSYLIALLLALVAIAVFLAIR